MSTNHIPNRHFIDDIEWEMCMLRWKRPSHIRHQFVVVYRTSEIGEGHARWPPSCVHRTRSMRIVYAWHLLSDVHGSWSWNSTTNVSWTIIVVVCCCQLLEKHRAWMMLRAVGRCQYRITDMGQLMLPAVVQCRLPEEQRPLLMLPDLGLWKGHPTPIHTHYSNACRAWIMFRSIGQNFFPDKHMPC